ncbi:MAG: carboxypeptidase regulatory-like domain-containing protein [Verrucomicrobiae bacterium]|nr:carboxypeptidase regulatory-like domain-containing protein [Verrucomicrobiae bacterium]
MTPFRQQRRLLRAYLRRLPVILMLVLIAFSRDVLGQNSEAGAIKGQINDSWQGNPVPAVIVTVRGTTLGAETDGAGKYLLSGVPAGSHTLILSKNGYERVIIDNVKVVPGITTDANAKLGPIFFELDAFEATTEPIPDQKLEILQKRQKQSVVMDALGEEYIGQIGASDATDVAKRITGVTIQEGKFVVVRGLSDRYTSSSLNGAEIPSADSDKQAAQLDLIPAGMIKRMEVRKTFTPDLPGGFTGGALNIVTKSFPDRRFYEISAGMSYNENSHVRDDFAGSERTTSDYLAFDSIGDGRGLRGISPALVDTYKTLEATGGRFAFTHPVSGSVFILPTTRSFIGNLNSSVPVIRDDVWLALIGETGPSRLRKILADSEPLKEFGPIETSSPLNSGFSLGFGDNYKILGKESGFSAGINYDQEFFMTQDRQRQEFQVGPVGTITPVNGGSITNGVTTVKWGANFTTGIKPSENHELGFNFFRVQAADDFRANILIDHLDGPTREYQSVYSERSLQNFQIYGRHEFPELADLGLEWTTSISDVTQDDPNSSRAQYRQLAGVGPFVSDTSGLQPRTPTRVWREISENNFNNRVDLDLPFTIKESLEGVLSGGVYQSISSREYREEGYKLTGSLADNGTGTIGIDDIFASGGGIEPAAGIFDYDGEREIEAFYSMAEVPVASWLRFVGGGRVETTDLSVSSLNKETGVNTDIRREQLDVLPALGAVISPNEKLKLTLHWSQTLARPTYREIAQATFTDYENLRFVQGNTNLQFSAAANYDIRLEYFPKEGEVMSAGFFYKEIQNPIELRRINSEFPNYEYFNPESGKAVVWGVEAEYRRKLDLVSDYLANYTLGLNFAYIFSEVENVEAAFVAGKSWTFERFRPLFDQSPIVANGDLSYQNEASGIESSLSYNYRDRRLVSVTLDGPDLYENALGTLDFSFAKKFGKNRRWKLKFSARNLLNPQVRQSIDTKYAAFVTGGDPVNMSYRRGRSYGISLSYKF